MIYGWYRRKSNKCFTHQIPNADIWMGLAFVADDRLNLIAKPSLPGDSFQYHRFDLSPPLSSCSHYKRHATMGENHSLA